MKPNVITRRAALIPPKACSWDEFHLYHRNRLNEFVAAGGQSIDDVLRNRILELPYCKSCGSLSQFPTVIYLSIHDKAFTKTCVGDGMVKRFWIYTCPICDEAPEAGEIMSCVHE